MPKVTKSKYFTIENKLGLKAVLSSVGAGVKSLRVHYKPLIMEYADEIDYLNAPGYFGKTLCRVAGRIPTTITINGKTSHLPDATNGDNICLHGGTFNSPSFKEFEGELIKNEKEEKVIFTYFSKDGENGFPGNVTLRVIYSIPADKCEFKLEFEAETDEDTPISFSNHMYFNLDRDLDINDNLFQVLADRRCDFAQGTLLIDKRIPVSEAFDFRKMSKLGPKLDAVIKEAPKVGTLDHTFLFEKVDYSIPQVVLENDRIRLETYTTFEGVNFYVDNFLTKDKFVNRDDFKTRRAIAIEPQMCVYPLENIILKAGDKLHKEITYKIIEK
jgi:aldose 1-epimerase